MSSKNTWLWVTVAAALFAFIFLFEQFRPHPVTGTTSLLPDLNPKTVRSVQIRQSGQQQEIRVERTNNTWHLVEPVEYPAQGTNVQRLLEALQGLTVAHRISEQDFHQHPQAAAEYGIDPAQVSLILDSGRPIFFGHRTSPGDEVFVRIPGIEGVAIVDASVLNLFPPNANAWRERTLAEIGGAAFDRIAVTNAIKSQWSFILQRDSTNRLWEITSPLKARADSEKVEAAVEKLRSLRVEEFVTDDPKADLEGFGLLPPALTLALGQGKNPVLVLDFGKALTNGSGRIYARRRDQNAVVTLATNSLATWNTSYDTFRDRHLLTLMGPMESIHIVGEDDFTLQWQTNTSWRVTAPQNFPADEVLATRLARKLSELQVADFEQDTVTESEWPKYGLGAPTLKFTAAWAPSAIATNPPTELNFGTNATGQVFGRRIGEEAVYGIAPGDFAALPSASWQMRDRRIWNFDARDVVRIAVRQAGRVREIVHGGTNIWALAPGSQGAINVSAVENTVQTLGSLTAFSWAGHGAEKLAGFGITADSWELLIELKNGQKLAVKFGGPTQLGSAYASVTLDNEPWIFEFPPDVYPAVQFSLPGPQAP